jgi:hypothetical protein
MKSAERNGVGDIEEVAEELRILQVRMVILLVIP